MHISVFLKTSNPAIDPPSFNVPLDWAKAYVEWDRARWIRKKRSIQMLIEHILDTRPVGPATFLNCARIESGTVWRVVGQTPPGGMFPSEPSWQLVP